MPAPAIVRRHAVMREGRRNVAKYSPFNSMFDPITVLASPNALLAADIERNPSSYGFHKTSLGAIADRMGLCP